MPDHAQRPRVATWLAIVLVALGLFTLLTVGATLASSDLRATARATTPLAVLPYGLEFGLLFGAAVGVLSVMAGVGLFQRRAGAWRLAVIAVAAPLVDTVVSIALGLLLPQAATGEALDPLAFYGGLVFSIVLYGTMLVVLLRADVRQALRGAAPAGRARD